MIPAAEVAKFRNALPYWVSLLLLPLVALSLTYGGWAMLLPPAGAWWLYTLLDAVVGKNSENPDPDTPESALLWYRFITWIWLPVQLLTIYGAIWAVTHGTDLTGWERLGVVFGIGVLSGSIGIVYAHELMHQPNRGERWLADLLLATVLYSHFRTEHLLVHHPWVGTRRDGVTARYNEGFHRFFFRVAATGLPSAWNAEKAMLARRGKGPFDRRNPFWRYGALQALALAGAFAAGGWEGVGLFAFQALVAIWQLEMTNYVEHYGLTRKYLGDGRYEPVRPHHSWNADHRMTSWLLINLQRHSDHHYKPARRYPLLQTYPDAEAPQLPFGYTAMGFVAMVPPVWRRVMNKRVRQWRRLHYPEITDWGPYRNGTLPLPEIR
ncbi:MAG: alkane 1-monooxygenase [Rhodobacterales bacterium]|nr:MAG: alkane 1-monooxygenase [Rhodobacterales bacterium]